MNRTNLCVGYSSYTDPEDGEVHVVKVIWPPSSDGLNDGLIAIGDSENDAYSKLREKLKDHRNQSSLKKRWQHLRKMRLTEVRSKNYI